jgi:F0F1-type ATP synthase gamma subunit
VLQRADTIESANRVAALREELHDNFHRLRQSIIDEEIFDLISGFDGFG